MIPTGDDPEKDSSVSTKLSSGNSVGGASAEDF